MLVFLMILNFAFGRTVEKIPQPESDYYRCQFKTENHLVEHYFRIDQSFGNKCEYAIIVDNKIIIRSRAFADHCQEFMRKQVNKGSACMTNEM